MAKNKMVVCKSCNTPILKKAKICPNCGVKNKKPIYKRVWFIILVIILVLAFVSVIGNNESSTKNEPIESTTQVVQTTTQPSKQNDVEETSEKTVEKTTEKEEKTTENQKDSNALRPEFKEAMDSYEDFMNEYVAFMKKYKDSNGADLSLLADYSKYMSKYADFVEDFEKWEDEEMNDAELAYYIKVQNRVSQNLLEVAY